MLAADRGAAAALLEWYDGRRRDLPWRRRSEAWPIWVSEVMLQQTRVETAAAYYDRFLERFPDVETLAAATEEEVLAAWSGLGYYRRARHLHAAARQVVDRGAMPSSAAEWRRLPGVGEYTAAAIASIAGGESIPVLDGNVERVVSRLLASAGNPKHAAPRRELATAAAGLLDTARPGDSNQALMELGATVCLPRTPACSDCPLQPFCAGFASGRPEDFPAPRPRPSVERVRRAVFVARTGGGYLLVRRSARARQLAGFWELPWLDGGTPRPSAALEAKYGGAWEVGEPAGRLRHAITRRRFEIEVFAASWQPGAVGEGPEAPVLGFHSRREIHDLATSSLVEKVLGPPSA